MKLKLIAAAAALALSGAANAAIDNGVADGHGDFFFNIWDGASSYTFDLNVGQNTTAQTAPNTAPNAINTATSYVFNLAGDALFQSFLATANLAELQWNVLAMETQAADTLSQTYTTLPDAGIGSGNARSMVAAVQGWLTAANLVLGATDSIVQTSVDDAYAGRMGCNVFSFQNFSTCGTLGNNSAANGLNLANQNIANTGTALSTFTQLANGANPVKVYLDSNYQLHIAAVPEPETYAMLLAGLGLMGAIARRRRQQQG